MSTAHSGPSLETRPGRSHQRRRERGCAACAITPTLSTHPMDIFDPRQLPSRATRRKIRVLFFSKIDLLPRNKVHKEPELARVSRKKHPAWY
jgi:hypothetical protein